MKEENYLLEIIDTKLIFLTKEIHILKDYPKKLLDFYLAIRELYDQFEYWKDNQYENDQRRNRL